MSLVLPNDACDLLLLKAKDIQTHSYARITEQICVQYTLEKMNTDNQFGKANALPWTGHSYFFTGIVCLKREMESWTRSLAEKLLSKWGKRKKIIKKLHRRSHKESPALTQSGAAIHCVGGRHVTTAGGTKRRWWGQDLHEAADELASTLLLSKRCSK